MKPQKHADMDGPDDELGLLLRDFFRGEVPRELLEANESVEPHALSVSAPEAAAPTHRGAAQRNRDFHWSLAAALAALVLVAVGLSQGRRMQRLANRETNPIPRRTHAADSTRPTDGSLAGMVPVSGDADMRPNYSVANGSRLLERKSYDAEELGHVRQEVRLNWKTIWYSDPQTGARLTVNFPEVEIRVVPSSEGRAAGAPGAGSDLN